MVILFFLIFKKLNLKNFQYILDKFFNSQKFADLYLKLFENNGYFLWYIQINKK
jgi:hypothetical protein